MTFKFILQRNSPAADAPPVALSEHVFEGNLITIGSDAASTIVLKNALPEQAIIIREGEQLTLINSGEGTRVNKRDLRREAMEPLNAGDEIEIGNHIIFVTNGAANGQIPPHQTFADRSMPTAASIEEIAGESDSSDKNTPENEFFAEEGKDERKEEIKEQIRAESKKSENETGKPARNFADVLNALRTEEDSFYFVVENGAEREKTRVPLEQAETPIGLNNNGQITCAANQINALYAIVRKDWSGIIVESQRGGAVKVNEETIKTTARLRNGDRLTLSGAKKTNRQTPYLELHEPSSLVALESILETRSRNGNLYGGNFAANNAAPVAENAVVAPVSVFERNFFGYFSFFEVAAMAIGTLIAAVLIFLLLEFSI